MNKNFPIYASAKDARCFNCGGELVKHCASGNGPGDGDRKGYCGKCCMSTWYDLSTEPIRLCECGSLICPDYTPAKRGE